MDQVLRVRVLGGGDLTLAGRSLVDQLPAKAAALVFHLALTDAALSRSAVAGLLWSDLPEDSARANLRVLLTKLRKALPEQVVATRQSLSLADGLVWVDAAEVARAGTDDVPAEQVLAAVRLCDGDLLDGFVVPGASLFEEWVAARRPGLHADMLAVMDRAVRQARDRRDIAAGIEVARRMVGLEPLLEEAHRALMWFLAVGERRSAAVAQYETCRYLLREELGIDPSPATVALRDRIVGEAAFGAPAPTSSGGAERGVELRPDAAASSSPKIPLPLTSLIGREAELARLAALLDDPACRLVTLVGPGGIGKTRLATELAAGRGVDRQRSVFVSFVGTEAAGPGETEGLIVAAVARALGLSLAVPLDPTDVVADHLTAHSAGGRSLLVLDNLEHLRDGAAVIAELLARVPALTMLVTSRRPLGLGVEWLVEVPGLTYPPVGDQADTVDAVDTAAYPAVQLFHERARLVRPGYRIEAGDEGAIRICRLVAGAPLAIELAARWVRSASPAAIADRLAEGTTLLETTSPDVEPRHRSLRAVIDWSYGLLTDGERTALCRLSVLRHDFDLDAAAAVAEAGLPVLARLVDQSLVVAGEDGRYSMHELVRQYAAERLREDPTAQLLAQRRHADHFATVLAQRARGSGPAGAGSQAEVENLRAATEWIIVDAPAETVDTHLDLLWTVARRAGWFREAQAILEAALDRDDPTTLQRAHWHRMLGEVHQQLGEAQPARYHLEQALQLLGHRVPPSRSGWLAVLAGQAVRRSLGSLRPAGPAGHRDDVRRRTAHERASAGFALNEVYWVLEDHLPVLPNTLRLLTDAERTRDADLLVRARAGLGMTVGTVDWRRMARRQLDGAGAVLDASRDPVTACWFGILAGLHGIGTGDWSAVEAGAARALEVQRDSPTHRLADQVLLVAGVARYLQSRYPAAVAAAAESLASGRARRDPVVQLWALAILIETALRADPDAPALEDWFAEAHRLLPKVARVDAARLHGAAARQHLAAGRPIQAWDAVREADRLLGPRAAVEQYALEGHAAVPEVCLALLDLVGRAASPAPKPIDPDALRSCAATGRHRLDQYARAVPIARPRALICAGWAAWLDGRPRSARRAWVRAVREAQRLGMPYDLARAHDELGRHLEPGRRSALGLEAVEHLRLAEEGFRAAGCSTDAVRVQAFSRSR